MKQLLINLLFFHYIKDIGLSCFEAVGVDSTFLWTHFGCKWWGKWKMKHIFSQANKNLCRPQKWITTTLLWFVVLSNTDTSSFHNFVSISNNRMTCLYYTCIPLQFVKFCYHASKVTSNCTSPKVHEWLEAEYEHYISSLSKYIKYAKSENVQVPM